MNCFLLQIKHKEIDEMISIVDKNGDGKISYSEFRVMLGQLRKKIVILFFILILSMILIFKQYTLHGRPHSLHPSPQPSWAEITTCNPPRSPFFPSPNFKRLRSPGIDSLVGSLTAVPRPLLPSPLRVRRSDLHS